MHVLVLTGIFHPESGGPATYLYHFLPELLKRGHTLEVVTFGKSPPSNQDYGYPVTRIPRTNIIRRYLRYYRATQQRLAKTDVLFLHSPGLPIPRSTKPRVLKIVGDYTWERAVNKGWILPTEDIDHFQTARYGFPIRFIRWAQAREVRRTDKIIVPGHYLRQLVIGWGAEPDRVQVIHNALVKPESPTQATRAALNLPEGKLLLMVARLTAWKGGDVILKALADPELSDIHLRVAGTGSMLPEWQKLADDLNIADRVKFMGKIPHEELLHYYAVADYTILYSGYEGLSHTILESLNAGTPVIASDKCGNPEIVEDGKNGFLVPYRDVDALKETLKHAFEGDTPHRIRQTTVLDTEKFSWPHLVEETITVLESQVRS